MKPRKMASRQERICSLLCRCKSTASPKIRLAEKPMVSWQGQRQAKPDGRDGPSGLKLAAELERQGDFDAQNESVSSSYVG